MMAAAAAECTPQSTLSLLTRVTLDVSHTIHLLTSIPIITVHIDSGKGFRELLLIFYGANVPIHTETYDKRQRRIHFCNKKCK
jgi:hypothetical protein